MNAPSYARPKFHGRHVGTFQRTVAPIRNIQFREPSYSWKPQDPTRATVRFLLTFVDDKLTGTKVTITRRRRECVYENLTLATLLRFNCLFTTPLLSQERIQALWDEREAQRQLDAAKSMNPEGVRLLDRVDGAIRYGRFVEMMADQQEQPEGV